MLRSRLCRKPFDMQSCVAVSVASQRSASGARKQHTPKFIPTLGKRTASVASTIKRGDIASRFDLWADSATRGSGGGSIQFVKSATPLRDEVGGANAP